jgi:hypothetical protein
VGGDGRGIAPSTVIVGGIALAIAAFSYHNERLSDVEFDLELARGRVERQLEETQENAGDTALELRQLKRQVRYMRPACARLLNRINYQRVTLNTVVDALLEGRRSEAEDLLDGMARSLADFQFLSLEDEAICGVDAPERGYPYRLVEPRPRAPGF